MHGKNPTMGVGGEEVLIRDATTVLYSLEWIPNNDKTFEELALRVGVRLAFGNNGNYSDIVLWCVENGIESNRTEH